MNTQWNGSENRSGGMQVAQGFIPSFSQFLFLPVMAFAYSMEMFAVTLRGLQHIGEQGEEPPVGLIPRYAPAPVGPPVAKLDLNSTATTSAETKNKETKNVSDTNLNSEDLKLVRYKILFVKRDYEHAFPEVEELVADNISEDCGYTAWKIAEFIQSLHRHEVKVPAKWRDHKCSDTSFFQQKDGFLIGFKEDDKKFLRVYFDVLKHYPREKFEYHERQIAALECIQASVQTIAANSSKI